MNRRILMTTTAYPPSTGGVQAHVSELRQRLEGFDADIATLWTQYRSDWLLGTTIRLGEANRAEFEPGVVKLGWSAGARARMAAWVATYYAMPAVAAPRIAQQMVPVVSQAVLPSHALIHNHRIGREFLAQASLRVARQRGLPFVLTPHHHPKWKGWRYQGWTNVYRAADAVLVLTRAELEELVALGVGPDRLHVIGGAGDEAMPADASRFRPRIGGAAGPILLFLGQLWRYKGFVELVEAAGILRARGSNCEVVLIGPATPFSERFLSKHMRPWLHVLGVVDRQTKWDAIEAATVVCLPSHQEAFGRVYLEAWSKAKPVIGGRIPAVSEVVTDGRTGLLVQPGSVDQLVRAVERILADPQFAARLGTEGLAEVEGRFNWREVVSRVESVYESVLAGAAHRQLEGR